VIHRLFPTPLGEYSLGRELSKDECDELFYGGEHISNEARAMWSQNEGNLTSWQSNILAQPKLSELRKFIETSIDEYAKEAYNFRDNAELYLTQSWVNLTKPGGHHHNHTHQNSIVSGTMYIGGNDDDIIEFYHPVTMGLLAASWHFPPKEYNEFNSGNWWMPARKGTLYLWPSHLIHGVPTVSGNKDRYSLSFNTFIRGEIGDHDELTRIVL